VDAAWQPVRCGLRRTAVEMDLEAVHVPDVRSVSNGHRSGSNHPLVGSGLMAS
jgi:hypothetical protein